MMQNMNYEEYGVVALSEKEMGLIVGGEEAALPPWLKGAALYTLYQELSKHWPDIKKGFSDGWNSIQ